MLSSTLPASPEAAAAAPVNPDPPIYWVPVVFHLLLSGRANNQGNTAITDQQVQAQLDVLNQDLLAANADLSQINGTGFESKVGSARIQFCLAKRDNDGTPTSGIERIDAQYVFYRADPKTTDPPSTPAGSNYYVTNPRRDRRYGISPAVLPPLSVWPSDKYLNVWVCNLNENQPPAAVGMIGFATFPGEYSVASQQDGIVLHTEAFGTTASGRTGLLSSETKGRNLTHEVGHWLSLRHIWGDNGYCPPNDVDDGVDDTPKQGNAGAYSYWGGACPTAVSTSNYPTYCVPAEYAMYMNFMDYTAEACRYMFSAGQATQMRNALNAATPLNRASVLNSVALAPTQAGITSSLTGTAICTGDRTNYRFKPVLPPSCGGTYTYQWTVPTGWFINSPTAMWPTIIPDGEHGGTVSVVVAFTNGNGSMAVTLPSASITISLTPSPYSAPAFVSTANAVCAGQALSLAVNSVAGATGYSWTIPAGFSPSGTVATTNPYLALTAPTASTSATYTVLCQATYTNNSCPISPAGQATVSVGGAPVAAIIDAVPGQRDTRGWICIDRNFSLKLVPDAQSGALSSISWTITSGNIVSGQGTLNPTFLSAGAGGASTTITATFTSCGFSGTATYTARTANSGTDVLNTGYDCRTAPHRPYPNPANTALILDGLIGKCTLYNSQGQPVATYEIPPAAKSLEVPTARLAPGFYALVGTDETGAAKRFTIQIQH